jgi:hypothetical protein
MLPNEILHRDDKGRTTNFLLESIHRARPFVTRLLLKGALAQRNIIDTGALAAHLTDKAPIRPEQFYALLACVAAEIWVRRHLNISRHDAYSSSTHALASGES